MKVTEYTSEKYTGKIFSKEWCLHDLCIGIKGFDRILVREIAEEFLDMVVYDMIENNDIFIFPIWNFAYSTIENICNDRHADYKYDIINGSDRFYQPVIKGDGMFKRINGIFPNYIMRFIGKTQEFFESVTTKGHYY